MKELTYEQARAEIKNGDIINMYRYSGGLKPILHALIQFFTGSAIYHTVVAIWMTSPSGEKRLMCSEVNLLGGKRLVPLSIYQKGGKMEVVPLPEGYDFSKMEPMMMDRIGQDTYGFFDLITIGLREFFGLSTKSVTGQVCSELTADLWVEAGVPLIDTHVSPGKLRNDLEKLGIVPSIIIQTEKKRGMFSRLVGGNKMER
jgi:hypothetical protein